MKKILWLLFLGYVLVSCARVGSPVGGTKDSIAPVLLSSNIDSPRVNVNRNIKELRLDFDEYVTLKEVTKNLIISPPIKKIKKILPSTLANKYVLIEWEDTLQAETTYNFNFGNAIRDNNEGNVLPYFNFAFSTGDKIDDLYISGEAKKLTEIKKPSTTENTQGSGGSSSNKSIVVGLYKESDSINFKEKPYYINVADEDGYFELNYLSPGSYRLVAFQDLNSNSIFDTGTESVGFLKEPLNIEKSISGLKINLYPSKAPQKYLEWKELPGGLVLLFQGNPEKVEVKSITDDLKNYKVTHRPYSDSVNVWFNPVEEKVGVESSKNLKFSYDTGVLQDTVSMYYRANLKNEMEIVNRKGNVLAPKSNFVFSSNYLVEALKENQWTLDSDSISQPFTAKISQTNPYEVLVSSDFKEGKKYSLTVPKTTVSSFYESINKSYRFDFEIGKSENYGSFILQLQNAPQQPFWVQLLDKNDEIVYHKTATGSEIRFDYLKPETYTVRILVDNNENGFWDEADLQTQTDAEDVFVFDKKLTARALWEIRENWDLKPPVKEEKALENSAPETPDHMSDSATVPQKIERLNPASVSTSEEKK